ncbi:MAG: hypothetical protein AAGG02_06995 [Cyanobacteria bacterium P01_H01_bin.15]
MTRYEISRRSFLNLPSVILITLGFWLSASLVIDVMVLPALATAGMTTSPEFASAGMLIFGIFNRVEMLCAAIILAVSLSLHRLPSPEHTLGTGLLLSAGALFVLPLIYGLGLIPEMVSLSSNLSWFESARPMTSQMFNAHICYWLLEVAKFGLGFGLLGWSLRQR